MTDLMSAVERERLVVAIVEAVAQNRIEEPVCAIVLNYMTYDGYFPPLIWLHFKADRDSTAASGDSLELVWMPSMERQPIELRKPDILLLCEVLMNRLQALGLDEMDEQGVRLLDDVARDLMAVEWTGKLPITLDFVVFPLEFEADSAIENIYRVAPTNQIEVLLARGLL